MGFKMSFFCKDNFSGQSSILLALVISTRIFFTFLLCWKLQFLINQNICLLVLLGDSTFIFHRNYWFPVAVVTRNRKFSFLLMTQYHNRFVYWLNKGTVSMTTGPLLLVNNDTCKLLSMRCDNRILHLTTNSSRQNNLIQHCQTYCKIRKSQTPMGKLKVLLTGRSLMLKTSKYRSTKKLPMSTIDFSVH